MELLQFVFSSFWVWLGCVVLIVAAGEAVATAAAGFRQKRKVSVYHVGDVTRVEVENAGRADIPAAVGQSSTEAERKRAARLENRALLPPRTNGGHLSDIRPPEIEIKKEIDIEIEKERELETGHPAPAAYGRYSNVFLSDKELAELKAELPGKWEYYIDRLSCHIASSGKKYKSHAATIYKWAQEDAAKGAGRKGIPDYSCREGESL